MRYLVRLFFHPLRISSQCELCEAHASPFDRHVSRTSRLGFFTILQNSKQLLLWMHLLRSCTQISWREMYELWLIGFCSILGNARLKDPKPAVGDEVKYLGITLLVPTQLIRPCVLTTRTLTCQGHAETWLPSAFPSLSSQTIGCL